MAFAPASFGDIVALIQVTAKVIQALDETHGASAEMQRSPHNSRITVFYVSADVTLAIRRHVEDSSAILERLGKILAPSSHDKTSKSILKQSYRRLKWTFKQKAEAATLQSHLQDHHQAIQTLLLGIVNISPSLSYRSEGALVVKDFMDSTLLLQWDDCSTWTGLMNRLVEYHSTRPGASHVAAGNFTILDPFNCPIDETKWNLVLEKRYHIKLAVNEVEMQDVAEVSDFSTPTIVRMVSGYRMIPNVGIRIPVTDGSFMSFQELVSLTGRRKPPPVLKAPSIFRNVYHVTRKRRVRFMARREITSTNHDFRFMLFEMVAFNGIAGNTFYDSNFLQCQILHAAGNDFERTVFQLCDFGHSSDPDSCGSSNFFESTFIASRLRSIHNALFTRPDFMHCLLDNSLNNCHSASNTFLEPFFTLSILTSIHNAHFEGSDFLGCGFLNSNDRYPGSPNTFLNGVFTISWFKSLRDIRFERPYFMGCLFLSVCDSRFERPNFMGCALQSIRGTHFEIPDFTGCLFDNSYHGYPSSSSNTFFKPRFTACVLKGIRDSRFECPVFEGCIFVIADDFLASNTLIRPVFNRCTFTITSASCEFVSNTLIGPVYNQCQFSFPCATSIASQYTDTSELGTLRVATNSFLDTDTSNSELGTWIQLTFREKQVLLRSFGSATYGSMNVIILAPPENSSSLLPRCVGTIDWYEKGGAGGEITEGPDALGIPPNDDSERDRPHECAPETGAGVPPVVGALNPRNSNLKVPRLNTKEWVVLFLFSFLYTSNIVVSNASLGLVTVPFHEVIRSSTPLFTVLLSALILIMQCSKAKLLALVLLVVGVGFATYDDYYFTVLGFFLELLGMLLAAMMTVVTNVILVRRGSGSVSASAGAKM
ncbi:hypothetical protein NLJ89_g7470 [Agrocybe chaxingu]|uniref:Uncharacterized protein n=1 Tax=Agrocybe chaxingu TaxID=84603 RepID=A0A9W8JX55_9AGAR|nr:hypothetical protein NLJ89_g7470 [Agrocybe chaxingu]